MLEGLGENRRRKAALRVMFCQNWLGILEREEGGGRRGWVGVEDDV